MARCVALYSVKSRQWLEVAVGRYDEGERELLLKTLDQLDPNDILVLDRGYPAWWLFAAQQGQRTVAYLMALGLIPLARRKRGYIA